MITGGQAKKSARLAEQAQAEQRAAQAAEKDKIAKIEAGQRANAQQGGGGLLAFRDEDVDEMRKRAGLKTTLGG